ncbi:DUF1501 domain-containing protein [Pseudomonadota bacterium]
MNRRDFLKTSLASSLLASSGEILNLGRNVVHADGFAAVAHPILVNVTLVGAPDYRHLLPPPFDPDPSSYGFRYWEARAASHAIEQSANAYEARWNDDYFPAADGSTQFGILRSCGWLARMWDAGNVAVICNAVGATTRDHAHCQLVMDQGNLTSGPNDQNRSGWGGRLSAEAGGNVIALTKTPRRFCYGPDPDDSENHDNSNLVTARNTRQMGLYHTLPGESPLSLEAVVTRSLESYYAAKRQEIEPSSIYKRFVDHEAKLRELGSLIDGRLGSLPLPTSISALYQGGLSSQYFGEQIRNLYDALAANDILNMWVASLELGNFDSHKEQKDQIEPKYEDMFGDGKGFDTLFQQIPTDAADNIVLVIGGEFGRQLRANGSNGTDHGRGNSVLVIGNQVNGGIYGDMFPEEELARLDEPGADINGLTDLDHVFGAVCDRIVPGSGDIVFPNRVIAKKEDGVSFATLFG